ncbi:hypothetical protein M422DRAFT_59809 [Sphaerobolus stellatus SS14]|uniref:Methyltransferase small domain-containing protein n=1 Tax=Sphaerobolus stellatus (strain SS14) TaxID=990650 RepID=A0A0C9VSZ4_SPHS4|nr:hypothetical protein M422DRAFT_59809 [Sphaerobolus stellatus SS14]
MIPTPDLSHLTYKDYDHVYEPAEDTFILLDALEQDADELKELKPTICLEIGSGSGCVSTFITQILDTRTVYLCTDINPYAAQCTFRTGKQNNKILDPIRAYLALPLMNRLKYQVDVLLFNPPYVPTITDELEAAQAGKSIEGAWAGGTDGMELTNKFLQCVEHLLSPKGRFYLVALKANRIDSIRQRMKDGYGLESKISLERRAGREYLYILCFYRPT